MLPPDATYVADYLQQDAGCRILTQIDGSPWRADLRRRVQHYGYRYDYKARRITADSYLGPLPDWLNGLAQRLQVDGVFDVAPDQVIVNEYQPGQGIASHVDCEPCFGEIIASLSLGSGCVMEFDHLHSPSRVSHWLEPLSLLTLTGESRFDWKHGIPARKSDPLEAGPLARGRRISLTFRNVVRSE